MIHVSFLPKYLVDYAMTNLYVIYKSLEIGKRPFLFRGHLDFRKIEGTLQKSQILQFTKIYNLIRIEFVLLYKIDK